MISRRRFMTRSGTFVVAGTLAWTVPTITSVHPASAAVRHSAPPQHRTGGGHADMGPPLPAGLPASLPFTGDNEQVGIAVGVTVAAAGAALVALGHEPKEQW